MNRNITLQKLSFVIVGMGILGVALSLLADLLPGAKAGIQSTQILGIEISIVVFLIGIWMRIAAKENEILDIRERVRDFARQIINLPVIAWVLAGFLIAYILFFVWPMFFDSTLRMKYFYRYIPDMNPIGNDLIMVIDRAKGWFVANESPYASQVSFYPPFSYMFFAPLLLIDHYPTLYKLFTLSMVLCYCFLTLILPMKMIDKKNLPLILLFFVTGLTSYGLQFELERGQYNVLTFLLCLWAIYIFHYHPKYRLLAYLLFSLSVQLKIYPAIFIVMLIDNWRDWKNILLRFAGIALFNFLLLFTMGYRMFLDFLQAVSKQLATPGWTFNGNHSIKAFVFNLTKDGFRIIGPDALDILRQNSRFIETSLFLIFGIFFVTAILISYTRNRTGIDPYLLMTCMMAAMIIPISIDYTLSIVATPVALVLCSIPELKNISQRLISILMTLGISLSYASMLIPFKYKPYYLNNAFPPLFLILIFVTVLNLIRYKNVEAPATEMVAPLAEARTA